MLLAIIPARGGSKGIPRKNLASLAGKPLIEYTIRAAQGSNNIDHILLSTDDDEIAEFGKKMGLDVSYRRPQEFAEDTTPMVETLEHAINWFADRHGQLPEHTMLLQPTSPLRESIDIDKAVNVYHETDSTFLVSVHKITEHPCECIRGLGQNAVYVMEPTKGVSRRQDYDNSYYYINGAIYIANTEMLLGNRSFVKMGETYFFEIPKERGVDVDTYLDLCVAEGLVNIYGGAGKPNDRK